MEIKMDRGLTLADQVLAAIKELNFIPKVEASVSAYRSARESGYLFAFAKEENPATTLYLSVAEHHSSDDLVVRYVEDTDGSKYPTPQDNWASLEQEELYLHGDETSIRDVALLIQRKIIEVFIVKPSFTRRFDDSL